MAAHVAHEVRNSLVPMTLYVSLLKRRLSDDAGSQDIVAKIASGFTAIEATVADLLGFTCDREPVKRDVAVQELVEQVVQSLAPQLSAQGINCSIEIPRDAPLSADGEMLRRAVLNLVLNAIDAMPDGGELVITGYNGAGEFELEIADSGAGIPDDAMDRIFDPFFSTKREGTGLGLALVQQIVQAHGGTVRAANCPEGGAAFTLTFSRAARRLAA
jgi:signal transduction histidine kinase